ncbi:MAG TPA: hypothetical protein VFK89_09995 [Actinomycetota bacterium]|nr:hypothetical protein [Actinomycetota bacterium]
MSSFGRADELAPRTVTGSARLGATLHDVLLSPSKGFAAVARGNERRARTGRHPAEGFAPYVLTAVGGMALTLLWLKIGALAGIRHVCSDRYLLANVVASLFIGAIVASIGYGLWGLVGRRVFARMGTTVAREDLRAAWGMSALPQVAVVGVLLPLDLLVVGQRAFMTTQLHDSVATVWAALSVAFAISLAVWSLYLFVTGLRSITSSGWRETGIATLVAIACVGIVVGALVVGASFLPEARGCPTRLG